MTSANVLLRCLAGVAVVALRAGVGRPEVVAECVAASVSEK
jgi:hypothetical protein